MQKKKLIGFNYWNKCEKDLIKENILEKRLFKNKIPILVMNTKRASDFIIKKMSTEKNYLGKLKAI